MQLTINSFRQLFPDKIFSLTFPRILVKSLTAVKKTWHFQVFQTSGHPVLTSSSAVAKRPHLLSPIVSGSVRPKPPVQTPPRSWPPPCLLLFVGRLRSEPHLVGRIGSGVRVSVSSQVFNKKTRRVLSYGSRKRGLWPKGGLTSLRLRRTTSSPSQTLRCRLVQTDDGRRRECSARRLPLFVAALFFTLRDS